MTQKLKAATLAARQKLISLKSKISSYAGKPTDTTVPAFLTALQQHLKKATAGPSVAYKNITLGQCVLAEKNLSNFLSELQAQTAELTSLLAAISPELNAADAVEKIVREVAKGKEDYEKRLLSAIDTVAVVHAKAEALLSDDQAGAGASQATQQTIAPRYVAREGCPCTLEAEASPHRVRDLVGEPAGLVVSMLDRRLSTQQGLGRTGQVTFIQRLARQARGKDRLEQRKF